MLAILRSFVATIVDYTIFAGAAYAIVRIPGHAPHADASVSFMSTQRRSVGRSTPRAFPDTATSTLAPQARSLAVSDRRRPRLPRACSTLVCRILLLHLSVLLPRAE